MWLFFFHDEICFSGSGFPHREFICGQPWEVEGGVTAKSTEHQKSAVKNISFTTASYVWMHKFSCIFSKSTFFHSQMFVPENMIWYASGETIYKLTMNFRFSLCCSEILHIFKNIFFSPPLYFPYSSVHQHPEEESVEMMMLMMIGSFVWIFQYFIRQWRIPASSCPVFLVV